MSQINFICINIRSAFNSLLTHFAIPIRQIITLSQSALYIVGMHLNAMMPVSLPILIHIFNILVT